MENIKTVTASYSIFSAHEELVAHMEWAYGTRNWSTVVDDVKQFVEAVFADIFEEKGFAFDNERTGKVTMGVYLYHSIDLVRFIADTRIMNRLRRLNEKRVAFMHAEEQGKKDYGKKDDATAAILLLHDFMHLIVKRLDNKDIEISNDMPIDIIEVISNRVDTAETAAKLAEKARREAEAKAKAEAEKAQRAQAIAGKKALEVKAAEEKARRQTEIAEAAEAKTAQYQLAMEKQAEETAKKTAWQNFGMSFMMRTR